MLQDSWIFFTAPTWHIFCSLMMLWTIEGDGQVGSARDTRFALDPALISDDRSDWSVSKRPREAGTAMVRKALQKRDRAYASAGARTGPTGS
jgi:hypothetical protein